MTPSMEQKAREMLSLSACGPERSEGASEVIGCQVHDMKVLRHNLASLLAAVREEAIESAAKLADIAGEHAQRCYDSGTPEQRANSYYEGRADMGDEIAMRCRALKSPATEKKL